MTLIEILVLQTPVLDANGEHLFKKALIPSGPSGPSASFTHEGLRAHRRHRRNAWEYYEGSKNSADVGLVLQRRRRKRKRGLPCKGGA